jgi:putative acetyltransferase
MNAQTNKSYKMNLDERTIIVRPVSVDHELVQLLMDKLDQYQIGLYGMEHCHLDSVEVLQHSGAYMLGAYADDRLVGMGAVKLFDGYAEIKRMFVEEDFRGFGVAARILTALEAYAVQKGRKRICLETGYLHQSALRFYQRLGYSVVERFGSYTPNEVSIYFEKNIGN